MFFRKAPKPLPPNYVPFYRRRFFIKKEFQGKFIAFYILAVAAVTGVATFLLHGRIKQVVEHYLYSSHIRVARTGDFLLDLMFQGNLWSMLAIVAVILLLSLVVFRRLNNHFSLLEDKLLNLAAGNDDMSPLPASHFNAIAELQRLAHDTQESFKDRHTELLATLADLETACMNSVEGDALAAGKARLDALLKGMRLPD